MPPSNDNPAVPNIPYYTPLHLNTPGAPLPSPTTTISQTTPKPIPTLFTPLTIRSSTLRNRIIVAPMCQYSTSHSGPLTGALTDYHIATLGHYALKGASLVFIEATGVQPNGRISPQCPGLWSDAQIPALRRVSDFIKSQGALSGIQLAHAGRKGSTVAGWVASKFKRPSVRATRDVGGWGPGEVVGPTGGMSWDGKSDGDEQGGFWEPRELTERELGVMVEDWKRAAQRAVKAGVDVLEIHGAHGYLIHQFLSPITNRRTDGYGNGFEGRTRLLREIVQGVRGVIPEGMPLFLRVSSTEWMEGSEEAKEVGGSWDVESTVRLAKLLPGWGVDLLDVSSGGNHPKQSVNMFASKDYQTKIAERIRREVRAEGLELLIGAVGLITEAEQARNIVEVGNGGANGDVNGGVEKGNETNIADEAEAAKRMTEKEESGEPMADVILVARQFMREPEWVLKVAWRLGVDVAWPTQFLRVRFPRL